MSSLKKKGGSDTIPEKHYVWIMSLLHDGDFEAFDEYFTLHALDPRKPICTDKKGETTYILYLAMECRDEYFVKHLLDVWGVDVNQGEFDKKYTALLLSIIDDFEECLDILLQQRNLHIDCLDDDNATPLMAAMRYPKLSIIKKLLLKNPNIYLQDKYGKTVFDHAKENNDPDKAREIIELILANQKKKFSSKEIFSSLQQADSKKYRLTKNTEYIDSDYTSVDDEQTKKSKNYFFNTQNTRETSTQGMKDINRVFDEKILEHIDEEKVKKNPFTRRPWSKTRINEFQQKPDTQAQQGGQKEYHTFNARRYVVRTGPKGGKFIVVRQKKIYV